jgi:hypothetical protein
MKNQNSNVFTVMFVLACFALSSAPKSFGVTPAPDGGYPGNNTAEGSLALYGLTSGTDNTAIGFEALLADATGSSNTAIGSRVLLNNKGSYNTATGSWALKNNTTGAGNTANGGYALVNNTEGAFNTAIGADALYLNKTGNNNIAAGKGALTNNVDGQYNTATGVGALAANNSGSNNTATGYQALFQNKGSNNIGIGSSAGANLDTGSNNIDIGNAGVAGESGKIRIGTKGTHNGTFIASISGVAVTGSQVVVNSSGKLGVAGSSARFKDAIQLMGDDSEAILALRPVTFRYKYEIDPEGTPQFGLVAEEVEKINSDLIVRDEEGRVFTVRYDAINAMLLNEFLKEHRKVEKLEAALNAVNERLNEQDAKLQQVSAQLEVNKPAPRLVLNKP